MKSRFVFSIWQMLIVVAIVAVLLVQGRSRMRCGNNLHQIGIALYNYESKYKSLPPAYTVDAQGNRLHSWRTLILPFLEQSALYDSIDLEKPWDHPVNATARATSVPSYSCPTYAGPAKSKNGNKDKYTLYLALVGESLAFKPKEGRGFKEFVDGLSNTIILVEANVDHAVSWMSPFDLDEAMLITLVGDQAKTSHAGGRMSIMGDASTQFLSTHVPIESLKKLTALDRFNVE
jgi:hypothetical protein